MINWSKLKLDATQNRSLYLQIADRLREMILSGNLEEGEKIPSSRVLQKLLGVSAITIENGLNLLVKEQLLIRRPRRGTFIAPHSCADRRTGNATKKDDLEYICAVFCNMYTTSNYWFLVLSTLEEKFREAGFALHFLQQSSGEGILNIVRGRRCRGVVLCGYNSEELTREIEQQQLPVVLIGGLDRDTPLSGEVLDQVVHNDLERAEISTRHLLDLEHRRISCVTGPSHSQLAIKQRNGFLAAMNDYGVGEYAAHACFDVDDLSFEEGVRIGYQILCSGNRPTAVYVGSDLVAIGIMSAADKLGIRVPQELSIIGCGALTIILPSRTRLTTTASQPYECARLAAEKLLSQIRDPDYHKSVSVVRVSTIEYGDSTMVCWENHPTYPSH